MKNAQRWSRLAEIRKESLDLGEEYKALNAAPYTKKSDRRMIEIDKQYHKLVKEATGLIFNVR